MVTPIGPINTNALPSLQPTESKTGGKAEGVSFQQMLKNAIQSTASMQTNAQQTVQTNLAGGDVTMVEALTDMRKADLAMRMMLQVRNKLLQAYDEIKQMQF